MSAPQTARERFEAWWLNCPEWWPPSTDPAWAAWQAAERSALERAAKVAEIEYNEYVELEAKARSDKLFYIAARASDTANALGQCLKAIRSLIT